MRRMSKLDFMLTCRWISGVFCLDVTKCTECLEKENTKTPSLGLVQGRCLEQTSDSEQLREGTTGEQTCTAGQQEDRMTEANSQTRNKHNGDVTDVNPKQRQRFDHDVHTFSL